MTQLPTTDSFSELAAFWQAHDLTDFANDRIEVAEPVVQRTERDSICLAAEDASALRNIARRDYVSDADLASKSVHERHETESHFIGHKENPVLAACHQANLPPRQDDLNRRDQGSDILR
jgi:hypothetical protein